MSPYRKLNRVSLITLVAVYVLILVGGIVRSTGAGMGCPDWPKCFGEWIPPTTINELPENYKEIYSNYRHNKNVRLAGYLDALGFKPLAEQLINDESIRQEADFNPVKTWIEYVNRLIGAIIGLLIFTVFVVSVAYWKSDRKLTIIAFITFILVGFQGWIGSIVVSTNLLPWTITIHMILALLIVALLIYLVHKSSSIKNEALRIKGITPWLASSLLLILIQIILGTQVREGLDVIATYISNREDWISSLGLSFVVHRSFSWLVLLVHIGLILKLVKTENTKNFGLVLILLILGTILSGTGMAYLSVPPFLQPVHLLLATITFGILFLVALRITDKQRIAI